MSSATRHGSGYAIALSLAFHGLLVGSWVVFTAISPLRFIEPIEVQIELGPATGVLAEPAPPPPPAPTVAAEPAEQPAVEAAAEQQAAPPKEPVLVRRHRRTVVVASPRPLDRAAPAAKVEPKAEAAPPPPGGPLAVSAADLYTRANANLHRLAPGDARLIVLLRLDRLRRSPHRAAAEQLLRSLPDYDTLLGTSGLNPIDTLEALLVASPNPFDVTESFVVARYREGGKAAAAVTQLVAAGRQSSDPADKRELVLLEPGVALFARPDQIAAVRQAPAAATSDGGTGATSTAAPDGGPAAPTAPVASVWVARLRRLEGEAGLGSRGPALVAQIAGIAQVMENRSSQWPPIPESLGVALDAAKDITLAASLSYRSPAEAETAATKWPVFFTQLAASPLVAFTVGLDEIARSVRAQAHGKKVELTLSLPHEKVQTLLGLGRSFLKSPTQ